MGSNKSKTAKPAPVFDEPLRKVDWNEKELLKDYLRTFQLNHPEVKQLRILLYGQVGAGKSCFINSVCSAFEGQIIYKAAEEKTAGHSCTKKFKGYKISNNMSNTLPFVLYDIMGLESKDGDGIQPGDVISALKGHIREGYTFNPVSPLRPEDPFYVRDPSLSDRIHCLVSVVDANVITLMDNSIIQKMKDVRKEVIDLGIPHVVLMTKVDEVCPLVQRDLMQVYWSKKITEKMEQCSNQLGPPMKCVFPVSNYYKAGKINDQKDVLILMALKSFVFFAKNGLEL